MVTTVVLSPTGLTVEELPPSGVPVTAPASTVGKLRALLALVEDPGVDFVLSIWDDEWNLDGGLFYEDGTVGELTQRLADFPPETLLAIRLEGLTSHPGEVYCDPDRRPGDVFQIHTYMDIAIERGLEQ